SPVRAVSVDEAGHLRIGMRLDRVTQRFGDARNVGRRAVLADLPLAVDLQNLDLDADYALDLSGDVGIRRVRDLPGTLAHRLVFAGQRPDLHAQPVGVVDHAGAAAHLHDRIVPGRHDLPGLLLGRIPGRRYVGIGALKHCK